jgi:phosphoribosylglycinamide formyltransferase-1
LNILTPTIILFASGGGSNARAIIQHFKASKVATVALIVCNKPQAGVFDIAKEENIPSCILTKEMLHSEAFIATLKSYQASYIVLAGFLWHIPASLVAAFTDKIINIHPSLLPKYGGKGMHGIHVHEAVISAKETISGITIHKVDEVYDNGQYLLQAYCSVSPEDDATSLAHKVLKLEHFYFPRLLEQLLSQG